jgi:hypothetical protein
MEELASALGRAWHLLEGGRVMIDDKCGKCRRPFCWILLVVVPSWLVVSFVPYLIAGEYWGMMWFVINMPLSLLVDGSLNYALHLGISLANGLLLSLLVYCSWKAWKYCLVIVPLWMAISLVPYLIVGEYWGMMWFIINMPFTFWAARTIGIGSDNYALHLGISLANGFLLSLLVYCLCRVCKYCVRRLRT